MSELRQIVSKVKQHCTYSNATNYWAPLQSEDEEDDDNQQLVVNNISDAEVQHDLRSTTLALSNQKASTMVLDSGATSSFVRPEENLPVTGQSSKVVNLPDGSSIQATHTTMLPFEALSHNARKAIVLPGLRPNSLVGVGKFADAGYTTVFHPRGEGVTVHQKNLFQLQVLRKPVLQGWRDANGLWRLSRDTKSKNLQEPSLRKHNEVAANVYSLPSLPQTIWYLHAAVGFPPKDT